MLSATVPPEKKMRLWQHGNIFMLPGIKIKAEIIGTDDAKSMIKWRAPHDFSIDAEDSTAGLIKIGFVKEQVVLYYS